MGLFDWILKYKEKSKSGPQGDPAQNKKSLADQYENSFVHEVGIALSGGSARGIAHIGVLSALDQYGMSPDIISGTSMGALVGVLYAAGIRPERILDLVKKDKIYSMVSLRFGQRGFFELNAVRRLLKEEIPEDDFSTLKKPFFLSVANITDGINEVKGEKGPLIDYVIASCSVPVILLPQDIQGKTYIDGGLFDNLPAASIKDKCRILIGVNVNYNGTVEKLSGIREIAQRTFSLAVEQNVNESRQMCDFLIEPEEMKRFTLLDFDKADELFKIGYDATVKLIQEELGPVMQISKIEEEGSGI
ncbi:patatin-like phospholipase family protein [Thermophagus sp. OGC60D27]|uniref:patatin-like phospholipase family protein n=1 Tax=Thermophagus sp. OGC60D27 TaxID=3458415 RepID=UPI00403793CC